MHHLYFHLKSYGFKNFRKSEEHLRTLSETRLELFLAEYLALVKRSPVMAPPLAGATDIYPDSRAFLTSLTTLKRLALYANRIYVHDDLLESCLEWPELDGVHQISREPERQKRVKRFRADLADTIEFLLQVEPLVSVDVVHLLPSSALRVRRDADGIYTDDFYGMDGQIPFGDSNQHPLITPEALAYLRSEMRLKIPALPGTTMETLEDIVKCPNRIWLSFEGERVYRDFHFFNVTPGKKTEKTGHINMFRAHDPFGQNIHPQMFRNWVEGSIRKVSTARIEQLNSDLVLAREAKARFTTDSTITANLLGASKDRGVNGVLNMELPYFDGVDFKAIAKARKNEDAFEEFRQALDKAIGQIPSDLGDSEFQSSLDELSRDFLRLPLLKIDKQIKQLRVTRIIQGAGAIGTLGLQFINPEITPLGLVLTSSAFAAELIEKNKSSGEAICDLPSFFYWQTTRGAAKNKRR